MTARQTGELSGEMEAVETKAFDTTGLRVASGHLKEAELDGPVDIQTIYPREIRNPIQRRARCRRMIPDRGVPTTSGRLNQPVRGGDRDGGEIDRRLWYSCLKLICSPFEGSQTITRGCPFASPSQVWSKEASVSARLPFFLCWHGVGITFLFFSPRTGRTHGSAIFRIFI